MLILSVVILYFGAEFSLDASEKIGAKLGLSPLIVGMLLIGFGTSLPEFFVGHIAAAQGKSGIAIGSLVGSNIANLFLILGLSGLFTNMQMNNKSLKHQLIVHLGLSLALWFVLTRETLTIFSAAPLLIICGIYLYLLFLDFKYEKKLVNENQDDFNPVLVLIKLCGGFGMLYIGGELLVKGASDLCTSLGISEYIVSAIFIAFGTSFPELVTSLMAIVKKKDKNLIVGNIIGSNLFNCAFILGSLGIYNFNISEDFTVEVYSLIFGASILLLLGYIGKPLNKLVSFIFLGTYGVVVAYWLKAF